MKPVINRIQQVEAPIQFDAPQLQKFAPALIEVDDLVRATKARDAFSVSGKDLTVAVLDTGLRTTHVDFKGRVINQKNYTNDNEGKEDDASDGQGHGTNVTGIIAANKLHKGLAPEANVIPMKVLTNNGGGEFSYVISALNWIYKNYEEFKISAVCMSLGDSGNYRSEREFYDNLNLRAIIQKLEEKRIAVVIAAGNDYFRHGSVQGMSYPAIIRECISVGAVYDASEGDFEYNGGAAAFSSDKDRITPFSQRLHESVSPTNYTSIFAPGAPVTSSGIKTDRGESIQHGTSQATPVTVGAVLLIQELYQQMNKELPSVDQIKDFMRRGGVKIFDGDDEHDNVKHTNKEYYRLDVYNTLASVTKGFRKKLFVRGMIAESSTN